MLGLILIGLAIASKTLAFFSEPHILIGTAICGSILILIAIVGIIGSARHHQVVLFFVSLKCERHKWFCFHKKSHQLLVSLLGSPQTTSEKYYMSISVVLV